MSTRRSIPWVLIIPAIVILALALGLWLTPLNAWAGRVATATWRAVLRLPGVAWLRGEMASTDQGQLSSAPASDADREAVLGFLQEGLALKRKGAYEQAFERYREALSLDEEYAPTFVALGELFLDMDREEDAIEAFEQAAMLSPDEPRIFTRLGAIYLDRDELDKAVVVFSHAQELSPDDSDVLYMLGVARAYRSYVDSREAVDVLEQAAELAPNDADIQSQLAQAYVRRNDPRDLPRAIAALERTLELDATQTKARYYLGQLYMQTGQPDEAIAAWERFVETSDDRETVAQVRSWLKNLRGQSNP